MSNFYDKEQKNKQVNQLKEKGEIQDTEKIKEPIIEEKPKDMNLDYDMNNSLVGKDIEIKEGKIIDHDNEKEEAVLEENLKGKPKAIDKKKAAKKFKEEKKQRKSLFGFVMIFVLVLLAVFAMYYYYENYLMSKEDTAPASATFEQELTMLSLSENALLNFEKFMVLPDESPKKQEYLTEVVGDLGTLELISQRDYVNFSQQVSTVENYAQLIGDKGTYNEEDNQVIKGFLEQTTVLLLAGVESKNFGELNNITYDLSFNGISQEEATAQAVSEDVAKEEADKLDSTVSLVDSGNDYIFESENSLIAIDKYSGKLTMYKNLQANFSDEANFDYALLKEHETAVKGELLKLGIDSVFLKNFETQQGQIVFYFYPIVDEVLMLSQELIAGYLPHSQTLSFINSKDYYKYSQHTMPEDELMDKGEIQQQYPYLTISAIMDCFMNYEDEEIFAYYVLAQNDDGKYALYLNPVTLEEIEVKRIYESESGIIER